MLTLHWTGTRPGFQWLDWETLERTELRQTLKGTMPLLLKGPSDRDVMICVHEIFWYFFQCHKCHRALGFILEVLMST